MPCATTMANSYSVYDEAKTLRSIRLTATAWGTLSVLADAHNTLRTDIIEQETRDKSPLQEIILEAIEQFIEI